MYEIEENKTLYKKRGIINEPTHAHIFHNNGITRLHCLGGKSIDGEVAMVIMIDTIKKVWRRYDPNAFVFFLIYFIVILRIEFELKFILPLTKL
jgi:hypothetical protein